MALEDATNPMQGVSGPGPYAKREDLEYKSQSYGDGVAYDANKKAAPLSKSPSMPVTTKAEVNVAPSSQKTTGLYDPSERLDENIATFPTSLVPSGKLSDTLAILLPYDKTGEITVLYQNALSRGQ
jgi:hypothetical protein